MFSACCRVAFINEYTRYCPKCGQECGIEYKETIPWIKCSESMPPDDEQYKEISSGRSEIIMQTQEIETLYGA